MADCEADWSILFVTTANRGVRAAQPVIDNRTTMSKSCSLATQVHSPVEGRPAIELKGLGKKIGRAHV
jgi:hypothetical protein